MIGEYFRDRAGVSRPAYACAPQPRTGDAVTTDHLPRKPLGKTFCAMIEAAERANGSEVAA